MDGQWNAIPNSRDEDVPSLLDGRENRRRALWSRRAGNSPPAAIQLGQAVGLILLGVGTTENLWGLTNN